MYAPQRDSAFDVELSSWLALPVVDDSKLLVGALKNVVDEAQRATGAITIISHQSEGFCAQYSSIST